MPEAVENGDADGRSGLPPLAPQRSALTSRMTARRDSNSELSPRPASGDFRLSLPEVAASTVTEYGTPNFDAFSSVPVGTPFGYLVNDASERRAPREQEVSNGSQPSFGSLAFHSQNSADDLVLAQY